MFFRSFLLLLIVLQLSLAISPVGTLSAQVDDNEAEQLQSDLTDLSKKIKALDEEIKSYNLQISQTKGQAKTLKQALLNLELRRKALAKDIEYTKLKISRAQENIAYTQKKIKSAEDTIDRIKVALAEALRVLVHDEEHMPLFISILAPNARISDALDASIHAERATNAINEKRHQLDLGKIELTAEKVKYVNNKKSLEALNSNLSDQKVLVEQTTKDKSTLLVATNNKESEYQKLLKDRLDKKNALESEMNDIESKLSTITDLSKLPKFGKGVLRYPLDKVVLTQYFGNTAFSTANPQIYNGAGHNGIDLAANTGTPVYSAASGVVMATGNTDSACVGVSYGKWVLIKHQNGLTTLYAHLSVVQVSAGEKVAVHQKIALSGNTGYSTGPHVHFTVFASDSVRVTGPTEYKSKVCGTYLVMPLAPHKGYLNPLSYL